MAGIWTFQLWRKLKTRKEVLRKFNQLKEKVKNESHSAEGWGELSSFLKRFTLLLYPRQDVGGLHGEAWLQFLNAKGHTKEFTDGIGALLISAPYQPKPPEQSEALLELTLTAGSDNRLKRSYKMFTIENPWLFLLIPLPLIVKFLLPAAGGAELH